MLELLLSTVSGCSQLSSMSKRSQLSSISLSSLRQIRSKGHSGPSRTFLVNTANRERVPRNCDSSVQATSRRMDAGNLVRFSLGRVFIGLSIASD